MSNYCKMFLLFLTTVQLFGVAYSYAQNRVISGRVVDAVDGLPVPGAYVTEGSDGHGAVTQPDGRFTITTDKEGELSLKASHLGYELQRVSFEADDMALIKMKPKVLAGEETVVIGSQLLGQARALSMQMRNTRITNVVSVDQVGRFPDANIGDALKRIPGLSVEYDQGEARFGLVRGTEARLNSVMLNGDRIPSAEGETRAVQLDLIPSDMISMIEVNKAVTPDMDADAIGGSINLVTRSAGEGLRIAGAAGGGFGTLRGKPIGNGSLVLSQRFLNNKAGVVFSSSYHNNDFGSDNVEADWSEENGQAYVEELQIRRYDVQRIRRSLSVTADHQMSPTNKITLRGISNHRDDFENRFRVSYKDMSLPGADGLAPEVEIRRETKGGYSDNKNRRLEQQKTNAISMTGQHVIGAANLEWTARTAEASEERPFERYISYRVKDVAMIPNIADSNEPKIAAANSSDLALENWKLKEITQEHKFTEETDQALRADLNIPLLGLSFKTGFRFRAKEKMRNNIFFEAEPTGSSEVTYETMASIGASARDALKDYSEASYGPGDYKAGTFVNDEVLGALDLPVARSLSASGTQIANDAFTMEPVYDEFVPGNYSAEETVSAGYLMLEHQFGNQTLLLAGLRLEQTAVDYQGNELNLDTETISATIGDETFSSILPGLHVRHNFDDKTLVRFAWTNTIARPNYYDLVPYSAISFEDEEWEQGNPNLKPTKSMNFDVTAERYLPNNGILSAGVFYKNITDFIYEQETKVARNSSDGTAVEFDYKQPQNGDSASLLGFELAAQHQLDFIPGMGVYGNYTLTTSSIEARGELGQRNGEDLKLPGTAEHTINASVSYEKEGMTGRASLNYSSSFIEAGGYGRSAFYDRYYDSQTHLDINMSYAINPQLRLFADMNNLLDQPLRYYQGQSDRTMQVEYYGRRFMSGLKFDL
jgi:TonB-dependent receptor